MLRRIFEPKRYEVTEECRNLNNEELNDLYSSPNIIRVIKSKRMKWARHIACMGARRGVYRVSVGRPEGENHLEDPGVDGRIILRWSSESGMEAWTGLIWLRIGQWHTERGFGGLNPLPPRNSEGPPKSCQTQPDCENC